METYSVNKLTVKGLNKEIKYDWAYLYVHKVGSISWSLEIDEVEEISIFRNAIRNREHLNITFSAEYMNGLTGNVMVKRAIDGSVELKGSGKLIGFND
ncbi:hypothetical protein ABEW59_06650 [Bacillus wiedmannii]|uniref:hypothetical protein n=1 Tax=Bacillus wiedmannii TaxID=1890302 RepID=UPI0032FAEF39|nr:hypothetical protein [Bacillus cereus]